jgi:CheY-like chemotaxis protein
LGQSPVVLVVIRTDLYLVPLMLNLTAQGLAAFGTSSLNEAARLMALHRPEVVVIDPTSEECLAALHEKSSGWQSLGLVAVAESDDSAKRAREMGIDEIIMANDTGAVVDAILDLLLQVSPPVPASGARLLIVDDDQEVVGILTNVLSVRGYDVINADSGREALGILGSDSETALVLLNIILPDGDGVETLRAIKQRHPHVIVILMGIADPEIANNVHRLGAFDCISKPIDYEELDGRIIAGLFEKESRQQSWWRRLRPDK